MNKLFDNIYNFSVTLGKESINFQGDITFSREFAIEHPGYKGTNHNNFTMGDIQYASYPILKALSHGDESVYPPINKPPMMISIMTTSKTMPLFNQVPRPAILLGMAP